jgi:N-acetylmuramoyl-L-alanine amidase|uniref:N-acetylmuramoyl-L-alanine amidase n=1 Tax=Mesoaciditoga lauensis TaxID=1495039 RepID=A0A7V3RFL5_9BACT
MKRTILILIVLIVTLSLISISAQTQLNVDKVLAGKIVVLDPINGGSDPGAIGPTGLLEKDINLKVALDLAELLKLQGATVILTRATDVYIPLMKRIEIANQANADLFVSMAHNSIQGAPDVDRPQVFYWSTSDSSKLAAKIFLEEFQKFFGTNGNLIREQFTVLTYAQVPAVVVEPCFLSNPQREVWLESSSNLWREATIYDIAILKYFNEVGS